MVILRPWMTGEMNYPQLNEHRMYIRIIDSGHPEAWYHTLKGHYFYVSKFSEEYYRCQQQMLPIKHCVIVKDEALARIMIRKQKNPKKVDKNQLTATEVQVLQLMFEELSTYEIGQRIYKSKRTIDGHRGKIIKKLGAKNSIGAIKEGLRKGILKL